MIMASAMKGLNPFQKNYNWEQLKPSHHGQTGLPNIIKIAKDLKSGCQ